MIQLVPHSKHSVSIVGTNQLILYREITTVCSKTLNLCGQNVEFLDAFAKLRKATVSFVMSVCPSAWNNPAPTGRIFRKSVEKIQVSLKSDKNNGYFT